MTCAETTEPDESGISAPEDTVPDPQFVSGRRACLSMFMMSVVVLLFASGIVALVVTIFNLTN